MSEVLCRRIRDHYASNAEYAHVACDILCIIIREQTVRYGEPCSIATSGIATGLACGVFMTNIYLHDLDEHVVVECASVLSNYVRFGDDVLVSTADGSRVHASLAGWRPQSIRWETTAHGIRSIPFLDLSLSIDDGFVVSELFRKDLNAYLYVPAASCHPERCKLGIVKSETERTFNLCSSPIDCCRHLRVFGRQVLSARIQ